MKQTGTYQLNQWDAEDRIRREDFNADNQKVEQALTDLTAQIARCGNCRIVAGSYKGTGTYGSSHRTSLTFDGTPLFLAVNGEGWSFCTPNGAANAAVLSSSFSVRDIILSWSETAVSWYSDESYAIQLNAAAKTYSYVALLATD